MEETAITTRIFREKDFRGEVTMHDDEVKSIYIYLETAGRGTNMLAVKDSWGNDGKLSDLLRLIEHIISEIER